MGTYLGPKKPSKWRRAGLIIVIVLIAALAYKFLAPTPAEKTARRLDFDQSVTESEKQQILTAVDNNELVIDTDATVSVATQAEDPDGLALNAYLPVTDLYASRQSLPSSEIQEAMQGLPATAGTAEEVAVGKIVLVPASELTNQVKLLALDGQYYLDTFNKGAAFRVAKFTNNKDKTEIKPTVNLSKLPGKDQTLKVNMSGVTALTRLMMRKLSAVGDPNYFSAKIGGFLGDADITHVSNEVSFKEGCTYSNVSFCSPSEFIETLKSSGVDLVEITGNHNNDHGSIYNTETINLYKSLGWNVFGGGLNTTEAGKPYATDQKGNKITFIGYNMADGPGSGAIAGADNAGANIYTEEKAKTDIAAAKQNSQFVIVNIQYAECQAYPSGYVEFPTCDYPISGQQEDFRQMIDLGADMVVGSSAHQPQTYELYNGKPIFYGLGNMYFDQTQWPGTERGIILSHYFVGGKLQQTRLSPTVYGTDLQTRLMDEEEASYLLERLGSASP